MKRQDNINHDTWLCVQNSSSKDLALQFSFISRMYLCWQDLFPDLERHWEYCGEPSFYGYVMGVGLVWGGWDGCGDWPSGGEGTTQYPQDMPLSDLKECYRWWYFQEHTALIMPRVHWVERWDFSLTDLVIARHMNCVHISCHLSGQVWLFFRSSCMHARNGSYLRISKWE